MTNKLGQDPDHVQRYSLADRINHWTTAICFVLLAISGLAFFHPAFFWLTALFGGGSNARAIHPWLGVILTLSFLGMFLRFWRLNLWVRADSAWSEQMGKVLRGQEESLPELGKYNAGQKIVFWFMTLLIPVLLITGSTIWDLYFYDLTSIETKRIAVLIHGLAAIGIISIWIAHVYAAYWVKGTIHGMKSGLVTSGWGYRHHRKWLREEAARERAEDGSTKNPVKASK